MTKKDHAQHEGKSFFTRFAHKISAGAGRPITFAAACLIIVIWAVTGPLFGYSDTWQLVINTGTTIITFLMVFLIQNTQNRDTGALQLKLDEIVLALNEAHNEVIDIENLDDDELARIHDAIVKRAKASARDHSDPRTEALDKAEDN